MLRPGLELPYERGAVDVFGIVFRALIVGRLTLPSSGRGTDREPAAGLPLRPDMAAGLELPRLCGGRGT